jgi:hypothetical protein
MLLEAIAPDAGAHAGPVRLVGRVVLHGEPLDFRELARRAIPEGTRYVVFDLDRTFHLGRNMGELLGWELCAAQSYGLDRLAKLDHARRGPFVFDFAQPRALLDYALRSTRTWALPGLFYLVWGKIAHQSEATRRLRSRVFGREPVRAVQAIPQTALFHQMAGEPLERVREVARRVWRRHANDLVVEAEDIAWLRAERPGVQVVISSASPQVLLDVVKEELGVDDAIGSRVPEHAGTQAAPFWLDRVLFRSPEEPARLAPPSAVAINASHAKIIALRDRFPDMFAPGVTSVGITDTGYGEDHCWAQHFRRVVDVNSDAPFSPIVPAGSPLEEIHSAAPLTRRERAARAAGDRGFFDPRRKRIPHGEMRTLEASDLERLLGDTLARAAALAEAHAERESLVRSAASAVLAETRAALARVEGLVALYNDSVGSAKTALLAELRVATSALRDLVKLRARVERPLTDLAFALAREIEEARARLELRPARA